MTGALEQASMTRGVTCSLWAELRRLDDAVSAASCRADVTPLIEFVLRFEKNARAHLGPRWKEARRPFNLFASDLRALIRVGRRGRVPDRYRLMMVERTLRVALANHRCPL